MRSRHSSPPASRASRTASWFTLVFALVVVACGSDTRDAAGSGREIDPAPVRTDPAVDEPARGETDAETESEQDVADETDAADADSPDPGRSPADACVDVGGVQRCYSLLVPASVTEPAPLLIDMHALGSQPLDQRELSGFEALARTEGFIVAWPQGVGGSFNAGLCCEPAGSEAIDDVAFVRTLVEDIAAEHPVELRRVYLTGLSNGCAMAQRTAAQASDLVTSVACMAFFLLDEPSADYAPVPVMEIHGLADDIVPYTRRGEGEDATRGGASENAAAWAERNGCAPEPTTTSDPDGYTISRYENCTNGAEVALVSVEGAGHVPYRSQGIDADTTRLAWDFLSRFSK